MIYFIRCKNFVKIGYSDNIQKRLNKFRCENPFDLVLINSMEGDRSVELDTHNYFKELHHKGDWFLEDERMYNIKEVPKTNTFKKKINTLLRDEESTKLLEEYKKKKIFIHEKLFTRYGWDKLDKRSINEYNKELTGVANYKTYLNVLKVKDILIKGYKNYKLVELTGLKIPTIINYRNLIQKNFPFWGNSENFLNKNDFSF